MPRPSALSYLDLFVILNASCTLPSRARFDAIVLSVFFFKHAFASCFTAVGTATNYPWGVEGAEPIGRPAITYFPGAACNHPLSPSGAYDAAAVIGPNERGTLGFEKGGNLTLYLWG